MRSPVTSLGISLTTEVMRVVAGAVEYLVWHRSTDDGQCAADHRRVWTYRDLAEYVDGVAAQLAATGVRRGSIIAIQMSNRLEFLVILMAVWRLGAAAAPVDPRIGRVAAAKEICAVEPTLVLDSRSIHGSVPRLGGVPCMSVDLLAQRAPAGWVAPAEPRAEDVALVYAGVSARSGREEIRHSDLGVLAWQTVRHLGLTGAAICSLTLPLARADVIAMNFLPAMLVGARIMLAADPTGPSISVAAPGTGDTATPVRRPATDMENLVS